MLQLLERLGAQVMLRPFRRPLLRRPPLPHVDVRLPVGDGLAVSGWHFPHDPAVESRGWVVFLHGYGDNRRHGVRLAQRLVPAGHDVLAYDGRGHGRTRGGLCTFGFHERADLRAVLERIGASSAVVVGSSLGASVALMAAAVEPRIRAVVAHAPYVDLRAAVEDRVGFLPRRLLDGGLRRAERAGRFQLCDVSPLQAAARIEVPVLLVHGTDDRWTPLAHSERILRELRGPARLLPVQGAGHADALRGDAVWDEVSHWVRSLPRPDDPSRADGGARRGSISHG